MKTSKRIICAIFAVIFILSGCNDTSLPVDEVITEGETYDIVRSKEDFYILPHSKITEDDAESCEVAGVYFKSLEVLRTAMLENQLTKKQLNKIRRQNALKDNEPIKIFDINNMYQQKLLNDFTVDEVRWFGDYYSIHLDLTEDEFAKRVYFEMLPLDKFTEILNDEFITLEEWTDTSAEASQLSDRNATQYIFDGRKHLHYTLTDSTRVVRVAEKYFIYSPHHTITVSDTVPKRIFLYITEGDLNYRITISGITSRPTEEWLLSFGMEPYVPEDTATE